MVDNDDCSECSTCSTDSSCSINWISNITGDYDVVFGEVRVKPIFFLNVSWRYAILRDKEN
jgi:hypothetical protein